MDRKSLAVSIASYMLLCQAAHLLAAHAAIEELEDAGFDTGELEEEAIVIAIDMDSSYHALAWGIAYGEA
jgi:hypothetical protein